MQLEMFLMSIGLTVVSRGCSIELASTPKLTSPHHCSGHRTITLIVLLRPPIMAASIFAVHNNIVAAILLMLIDHIMARAEESHVGQ